MHAAASKISPPFPRALTPRSKVWLEVGGRFAVGEWGIELLEAVRQRGSLRQAAVAVGWSYRHVWDYVGEMEGTLGLRLIERQPGRPREGSQLTNEGEDLLQALRHLQQAVQRETERNFRMRLRGGRRRPPRRPVPVR